MKRAALVFLLLCATRIACAQFEHPDLKSGKKQVHSIVLMPVRADITKIGMKGAEPMEEESRRVEQALPAVIAQVLQKLGCKVQDGAFTKEALLKDPDMRYTTDDLQKQFDSMLDLMNRKSKDVRKGRFTMGDSVAKLTAGDNADALLFVRASGQVLTGGKKTFGWIMAGAGVGMGVSDTVEMNFGLVDAKTGDVLYFAKPVMVKNLAKNPEDTRSGIEKSFKNFAKSNTGEHKGL